MSDATPVQSPSPATEPAAAALFLHDPSLEAERVEEILTQAREALSPRPVEARPFSPEETLSETPEKGLVLLMIPDDAFRRWLPRVAEAERTLLLLPYGNNPLQRELYALPFRLEEALALAVTEGVKSIDSYLRFNGKTTLEMITFAPSRWYEIHQLLPLLRGLLALRLRAVTISTEKGQEIRSAALMVEAGHEALMARKRAYFFRDSENQCRRVAAVLYAPQSILGAIKQRLYLARRKKNASDTLPPGIGTLQSRSLRIALSDGSAVPILLGKEERRRESEVLLESVGTRLRILTGEERCSGGEEKESVRVGNLPTGSDLIAYFTKKSLPLVPIAGEELFARLLVKLRESARLQSSYLVLLLLSVLMATTGLFQNSSPTIIGAMILAPLMAPIIAFSMGMVRLDRALMRQSAWTVLLSVLIALSASALFTWVTPFSHLTQQMASRTNPTLLDLAVAIFSGVAAAYGYANSKVGESLAGVAIAVALVPPLCVSGVGIGWGSWPIFSHAFLLFATNIVGIVVAAGSMFYLLGFASRRYEVTKALSLKLLLVVLIAIPLWLSTRILLTEESIYRELGSLRSIEIDGARVEVGIRGLSHREGGYDVLVTVRSPIPLEASQRREIAEILKRRLREPARLILSYEESY